MCVCVYVCVCVRVCACVVCACDLPGAANFDLNSEQKDVIMKVSPPALLPTLTPRAHTCRSTETHKHMHMHMYTHERTISCPDESCAFACNIQGMMDGTRDLDPWYLDFPHTHTHTHRHRHTHTHARTHTHTHTHAHAHTRTHARTHARTHTHTHTHTHPRCFILFYVAQVRDRRIGFWSDEVCGRGTCKVPHTHTTYINAGV